MKIKMVLISLMMLNILVSLGHSEVIKVGLEPFPPLINEDATGFSIDMLHAIEKVSDMIFLIKIMQYNRAKLKLKNGQKDLIGHTPYQVETKDFYVYAQELNWSMGTFVDIFSMNKANLEPKKFKTLKIGTPWGNEGFFSKLFEIPISQFHPASLNNFIKLMKKKRIDLFIFERASTMIIVKENKVKNMFYRQLDSISVGLAVGKGAKGDNLKKKLDASIQKLNQQNIFGKYFKYLKMPKSGVVPLGE